MPHRRAAGPLVRHSAALSCKLARNSHAYALGAEKPIYGFCIRRVVWSKLMANMERRPRETIKRAIVLIER